VPDTISSASTSHAPPQKKQYAEDMLERAAMDNCRSLPERGFSNGSGNYRSVVASRFVLICLQFIVYFTMIWYIYNIY
jgi:hypothetical protein